MSENERKNLKGNPELPLTLMSVSVLKFFVCELYVDV